MTDIIEKVARAIYNTNKMVIDGIFGGQMQRNVILSFDDCKEKMPEVIAESMEQAKAAIAALTDGEPDKRALEIAYKEGAGTWHNMTGKDSLNEAIASAIQSYFTHLLTKANKEIV